MMVWTQRLFRMLVFLLWGLVSPLMAQLPVAVLPFQNLHGLVDYNEICYTLADSLARALQRHQDSTFRVIHPDSVDAAVLSVNLNPDNPQFLSDRWIVAARLGATNVVTGTVNVRYNKVFVNVYVYDVKTKQLQFQIRNLYRIKDRYLQLVDRIVPQLLQFLRHRRDG